MDYLIEPWAHQLKAISKAKNKDGYGLFFEMGTGKTGTAINILRHWYEEQDRILRTFVLAPPIVLDNWRREFKLHSKIPKSEILLLTGSQADRLEKLKSFKGNILITNYEALAVMQNLWEAIATWGPEVLICDESHKCKDMTAIRTKRVAFYADRAKKKLILTGTPVLNSPMDLFAQFKIMMGGFPDGNQVIKNFFQFRARYFYDKNAGMPKNKYFPNWQIRSGAIEEMNRSVAMNAMHVTKEECMDLPELVRQKVFVELNAEQSKAYEEMKRDFITYVKDKACVATLAITKLLRLQQIVSGYVKDESGDIHLFKSNPRALALRDLLKDICETPQNKVLVWSVFKENYKTIRAVCDDLKLEYVEVHGEVNDRERVSNVDKFNNEPSCRVFIGHPGSGGIGINLVSSNFSIFYSRSHSLEYDLQAEARNHRGGQTRKVTRIDIIARNTIDELILEALSKKEAIGEKLLDIASQLRNEDDND